MVRAVRQARPSVVSIQGQKTVANSVESVSGADAPRQVNGMGTGTIIDERGYILTNYHVVSDVRRIEVTLDDGRGYTAELVAYEPADRFGRHQDSRSQAAARDSHRHVVRLDGRRIGDRAGQCVRLRANRDARHHQRAGPRCASQRHAVVRRPDSDRRQHQPGQLRRPAAEHRRRDDRRQRGRAGRSAGNRLRHSNRPGASGRRQTAERAATAGQTARLGDPSHAIPTARCASRRSKRRARPKRLG